MISFYTIFFLIIRIFFNPIANVLQKKLSYSNSSLVINFYTYLILSLFCIPIFTKFFDFSILTIQLFGFVLLAGFLCSLGTVCLIKSVNIGELSVIGPINSYKSIIGLVSAFVLLKEIPNIYSVIGILLIILGSKFMFETSNEGFSFSLLKRLDIQLRFLALILTGIEASILKKIILLSSIEVCFVFWCFSGLLWSFIFVFISKKGFRLQEKISFFQIFLVSICLGLMQYSTNYVFKNMNVGYALALFQLSSILTVIFGYSFFKEKEFIRKLLSSILMIIGAVIITLFS